MSKLIVSEEDLLNIGLHTEAIYTVEYDVPSNFIKNLTEEQKKFLISMRNKLNFVLKYRLGCIQNLESSWFLAKEKLESASLILEEIKEEYLQKNFNMEKRIKIMQLFTSKEDFETYEDRKAESVMLFLGESLEKIINGLHDKVMSETILWRCKKCFEHVSSMLSDIRHTSRYAEIEDELNNLDDKINQYENLKKDIKEQKKIERQNRKAK